MDTEMAVEPRAFTPTLSPSRAGDFQTCPLLYRFRVIDRLPEPSSPVMVRGTLIHAVLEELFGEAASGRTLERAAELMPGEWAKMLEAEPELAELFAAPDAMDEVTWLASAVDLLKNYFALEDPRYVEPAAREERVEHVVESGLKLAGIVDRLDIAPDGRIRVVDYKTGKAPNPRYEDKALFQMKFYALVIWRVRGVMPTLLQLMYFADSSILTYTPSEHDLVSTERKLIALWGAIESSLEAKEFIPRKSALCHWCAHQSICPEWGGTPPPFPELAIVTAPELEN